MTRPRSSKRKPGPTATRGSSVRTKRTFEVKTARAEHVADLVSRYTDLTFARNSLARLLDLLNQKTTDVDAVRAYWSAAITAYGRCFGKGKLRTANASGVVLSLVEGAKAMHDSIVWRRDKEVAHAVESAFNEVVVGATFVREQRGVVFDAVGFRDSRVFAPRIADVDAVLRHVEALVERLATKLTEEMTSLGDEIDNALQTTTQVLGQDVSSLFTDVATRTSDPLGMSLEVFSHDVANDKRRGAGKKPALDLTHASESNVERK